MTRDFDDWNEIAQVATFKMKSKKAFEKLISDVNKPYNEVGLK